MLDLKEQDKEIFDAIQKESTRQEEGLELIASENYTSKAVMEAMGTVLTNKYSEGYIGKRYYAGNEVIDESYDIMLWVLSQNDPDGWLKRHNANLIEECDGAFKSALDKYKYSNRHEGSDAIEQRSIASEFLNKLESILVAQPYLSGSEIGMTDMSIATFARQFANVDRIWFDNEPWPHLIHWLEEFLASDVFKSIMTKYPRWQPNDPITLFPEPA